MKYKYKYTITFDFGYIDELFIERWERIVDDTDDDLRQSMEEFAFFLSDSEEYSCKEVYFDLYSDDYILSFLATIKIDEKEFEESFNIFCEDNHLCGKYDSSKIKIKIEENKIDPLDKYRINFDYSKKEPKNYIINYDLLLDKMKKYKYYFLLNYKSSFDMEKSICSLYTQTFEDVEHFTNKTDEIEKQYIFSTSCYLKYNIDKIDSNFMKEMIDHDMAIYKKEEQFNPSVSDKTLEKINQLGLNTYLVESLIKIDGKYLCYGCDEFKTNEKIILKALKNANYLGEACIYSFMDINLLKSKKFLKKLISNGLFCNSSERYSDDVIVSNIASNEIYSTIDEKSIIESLFKVKTSIMWKREFVTYYYPSYSLLSNTNSWRNDKELILKVVDRYPKCITLINMKYYNDKDIMLKVLSNDKSYYKLLSEELKNDKDFEKFKPKPSKKTKKKVKEEKVDERQLSLFDYIEYKE